MGMLREPVPVTGFAENFSPIPLIAPPPLGSERDGTEMLLFSGGVSLFSLCTFCVFNICIAATYYDHSRVYSVSTGTFSTRLTNRLYHTLCSGSLASASAASWLSNRIMARNSRELSAFLRSSPERYPLVLGC